MMFKLKMIPPTATAQQKGEKIIGNYIHHYKKKNVVKAEGILRDALLSYVPEEPITGKPILLSVRWMFPYPKSAKKHQPGVTRAKITRPDTDNLNKMLKDVMTDMGFWKDDALIFSEMVTKVYSDEPGIEIKIFENPNDIKVIVAEEKDGQGKAADPLRGSLALSDPG
jgi:Holliday junction resolvase RusA-like endonuclease